VITEPEWNSIREVAARAAAEIAGRRNDWFQTGQVVKRDEKNRLIWVKGLTGVAIPIVSFNYDIRYYDTDENGDAIVRTGHATLAVPKVGQTVLIAFELGVSRLPRCLGVVQGKNYLTQEE